MKPSLSFTLPGTFWLRTIIVGNVYLKPFLKLPTWNFHFEAFRFKTFTWNFSWNLCWNLHREPCQHSEPPTGIFCNLFFGTFFYFDEAKVPQAIQTLKWQRPQTLSCVGKNWKLSAAASCIQNVCSALGGVGCANLFCSRFCCPERTFTSNPQDFAKFCKVKPTNQLCLRVVIFAIVFFHACIFSALLFCWWSCRLLHRLRLSSSFFFYFWSTSTILVLLGQKLQTRSWGPSSWPQW